MASRCTFCNVKAESNLTVGEAVTNQLKDIFFSRRKVHRCHFSVTKNEYAFKDCDRSHLKMHWVGSQLDVTSLTGHEPKGKLADAFFGRRRGTPTMACLRFARRCSVIIKSSGSKSPKDWTQFWFGIVVMSTITPWFWRCESTIDARRLVWLTCSTWARSELHSF